MEERKLLFLDVCLQREDDGSITTSVFTKATNTNQYLSFDSHHPAAHKAAVVRTLMCRASALSSNGVERVAEEKKVMEALRDNGYPSGFVHRHSDNRAPRRGEDDQREPRTSLTLPDISGLSETVRKVLRPLDIKVVFRLFTLYATNWFAPRILYQWTNGQEWCIRSPAQIARKFTLVGLAGT